MKVRKSKSDLSPEGDVTGNSEGCQEDELPIAEGASQTKTSLTCIAAPVRRGFRGMLPTDTGHVTASSTRQKIAMRVYACQKPIDEKDVREANSTRSLPSFQSREKKRKTPSSSSSNSSRGLPSLRCKQLPLPRGGLPLQNKSQPQIPRKGSSFMPRLAPNGVSRLSASSAKRGV